MRPPRRALLLFLVGLAVRLPCLPLWGTYDTEVQKAWSARAAREGMADIYGPSDAELLGRARARGEGLLGILRIDVPKTTFEWGNARYFVDYPPGSLVGLWAAGKLWGLVSPTLANRRGFNVAINLAPLVASMAIAYLLWRSVPTDAPRLGETRALAFWLNPAVILGAPVLGYQDTIFGALALGAVMAMQAGRPAAATALVVASGLVKPQGAILLPVLAVVLVREAGVRGLVRATAAGAATAVAILAPWWTSGFLIAALDGCRRPLGQGTLAPLGLNVWWIASYAYEWAHDGPWSLARIVPIHAFQQWAGWDPRLPARALLLGATLAIVVLLVRGLPREASRSVLPLAVILQVHAYALFGTSVHENHTFLAVILAPLLLGAWPGAWSVVSTTSAFLFASLFLSAGFGRRITSPRFLDELRRATFVDLSVLVALLHVVLVALLFVWAARPSRANDRAAS